MATKKKSAKKAAPRRAKSKSPARAKRAPARRAAAPKKPGLMKLSGATPSFTVNDVEKSLAFYRDVLGFAVKDRWEEGGRLLGAELVTGDVSLMIGQDDWQKGRDRVKGVGCRVYFWTAGDVDALAAGLKSRGATLDYDPKSDPWGRHFALTDLDGFKITIVKLARKG